MERGEVDGACGVDWTTLKSQHARWIEDKSINILVQTAFHKAPDMRDIPLIMDLTSDPKKLQILKLYVSALEFARPFAAPPGIPADRANALKEAFDAAMKDPDLLADAKRRDMEIAPVSGAKLAQTLSEIYAIPGDIRAEARAAIAR
jgi:hypothetical protein